MDAQRLGLAGGDLEALIGRVLSAWDGFIAVAERTDPSTPTRLPGWTAREVALHLGRWDDTEPLEGVLASARDGASGPPGRTDDTNTGLIAAHDDASYDDILAALHRNRAGVAAFLRRDDVAELGTAPSMSVLGPLPVLTILNAGCYELAVHTLDLGARDERAVLMPGLSALADVTGALASRQGMTTRVTVQTVWGGWAMHADPGGWDVVERPPGPVSGVAILGSAADVLDVAAGRAFGPTMLAQRRIKMQDLRGFLLLAPIVEAVPGIPGGPMLRAAARALTGAVGLVGRVPGFRR